MSVSHRVTGTWTELTADGAVSIPATPQAGDRMFLFARWKDFSVTATVANWTELIEFADGSSASGNGTGSVKVGCWYRDWQSGDADPTIDFSANPNNASVVIMVMSKGADDVWLTPVAVTAAMTNWTTSSQIVAASSTALVKSGGVVMGLIGIRDDTATMTRPTSGIDDSAGTITWNGNYVESPAAHHSTTTGDDGAADLGYRLVSVGATATLRMTGTISASETGAVLWVIQGTTIVVTPSPALLSLASFAPTLKTAVIPATASLAISSFAPTLKTSVIPARVLLTVSTIAPQLATGVIPEMANLTIATFSPSLKTSVAPEAVLLTVATFAPSLAMVVTPDTASPTIATTAPNLLSAVTPASLSLTITTFEPSLFPLPPPDIVYLDPGGDAVQAIGYFNSAIGESGGGAVSYDTTQQVVGVGSYKFHSGGSGEAWMTIAGVMGASRRVSAYFRYDSVPDALETVTESDFAIATYSGGGFTDSATLVDTDFYATATPAQNAGQGNVFGSFGFDIVIPVGAIIDSVKIIYERKYDTDTSIGISRVKYRIDTVEGSDHDNTDQPLADTVVEVDITGDRGWTQPDLMDGVFEVIAEARRGDTATSHTQSWDYVKVEVQFHRANIILAAATNAEFQAVRIAITPKGDGAVLRLSDGAGNSYDGITQLDVDTRYRISFGYALHGEDDLEVKVYLNSIEELSIVEASTGGASGLFLTNLTFGWLVSPGENHACWFDQIYIDDGDDLSDIGNVLMTAKLPALVNENNWNTTVGNGAVNERPLSETNYMKDTTDNGARQSYTLQAASGGDVNISGKTIVGYMGWAWAKVGAGDSLQWFLIVNGQDVSQNLSTDPVLLKSPFTSATYPSDAAGIGMVADNEFADTFMFECGVIVAYEGPAENAPLLEFQLLAEDSVTQASDDVSGENPDSYVIRSEVGPAPGATVTTTIFSASQGGTPQQQAVIESTGGEEVGHTVVAPGEELSVSVEVSGADAEVGLARILAVE